MERIVQKVANAVSFIMSLIFLTSGPATGQGQLQGVNPVRQGETVCGKKLLTEFSFTSNREAHQALEKVIGAGRSLSRFTGLSPQRFDIKAAKVHNALACEDLDSSVRYILYNPNWISGLRLGTGTDWASVAILAHELGHHVLGHTIRAEAVQSNLELEADVFAGQVLAQMGASLAQALAAWNTPEMCEEPDESHPKCEDRLAAVERGYRQNKPAWVPGKAHPSAAYVIASQKEGHWEPAPGYDWDDPNTCENGIGLLRIDCSDPQSLLRVRRAAGQHSAPRSRAGAS